MPSDGALEGASLRGFEGPVLEWLALMRLRSKESERREEVVAIRLRAGFAVSSDGAHRRVGFS